MESISKLISQSKRLALEEEELLSQVIQLKSALWSEELNLNSIKKEYESYRRETALLEQTLEGMNQEDSVKSLGEFVQISTLLTSFTRSFIDKTDPTCTQQMEKLNKMSQVYSKMLSRYELTPLYQAILREEANEKELAELTRKKKEEIQQLETEYKQIFH